MSLMDNIPAFIKKYPHEIKRGDLIIASQHIAPVRTIEYDDVLDMWYITTAFGQRRVGPDYALNVYEYVL